MCTFHILVLLVFFNIALNIYTYFLDKRERDKSDFEMKKFKEKYEALYRKVVLEFTHIKNRIKVLEEPKKKVGPKKNGKNKVGHRDKDKTE